MDSLAAVAELMRLRNAVAAAVLTVTGAVVAGGLAPGMAVVAAAVATVAATGAGNAINDLIDRPVDAVNRPDRPLPRGAVTPTEARVLGGVLVVIALASTLVLPPLAIAIAAGNLLALGSYTQWFKGRVLVGNLLVGWLTGSTVLFGAAAVRAVGPTVAVLGGMVIGATVARELIKDIEDAVGDATAGLQTAAIVWGRRRTVRVAMLIGAGSVALSLGPVLLGAYGLLYIGIIVVADVLLMRSVWRARVDASGAQRALKRAMYVAMVAFLAPVLLPIGM
jgi:geranylgeranylglycerol-phosphate geranylgeranyltransferase